MLEPEPCWSVCTYDSPGNDLIIVVPVPGANLILQSSQTMEIQSAMLCDSAAAYAGKLCVLGAFDTIRARQFPARHHHCAVAVRALTRDEDVGLHQLQARFIDPDGNCVLPDCGPTIQIECRPIPEQTYFVSQNYIFNINGLPLPAPGQYRIDLTFDGKVLAQIPLQVIEQT